MVSAAFHNRRDVSALTGYYLLCATVHAQFASGPPGGLTLPYTKMRLSDAVGGVYGPGASAASTGLAARRPAIQAALAGRSGASDGSSLEDMLEFYTYHAEHGSAAFALSLARVYYQGSVYGPGEAAGAIPRDYGRAMSYALGIGRSLWPTDAGAVLRGGPAGREAKTGQHGFDIKLVVDEDLARIAGVAAGFAGRMFLRGEGVRQDFARAWVWFSRGADQVSPVVPFSFYV